jgi:mannose-1-phosphate guanylyltransferase
MTRPRRLRGDSGQVGGIEVIPFGILTFVIAMLVIANAWGAIDADLATTSAAREAVRAFVEAPDEDAAQQQAVAVQRRGRGG